jgi:hypothetical protein
MKRKHEFSWLAMLLIALSGLVLALSLPLTAEGPAGAQQASDVKHEAHSNIEAGACEHTHKDTGDRPNAQGGRERPAHAGKATQGSKGESHDHKEDVDGHEGHETQLYYKEFFNEPWRTVESDGIMRNKALRLGALDLVLIFWLLASGMIRVSGSRRRLGAGRGDNE